MKRVLAILVAGMLAVAGCGGGDDSASGKKSSGESSGKTSMKTSTTGTSTDAPEVFDQGY
jgi:ABC-type glycerol-3-phosphate transport system substrate-binding protein